MEHFEHVGVKNLISRLSRCSQDWGERDCVYAYHKFYYFMEGEATLIINGDVFIPQPEELYLIPSNTQHTYFQNEHKPVLKYWSHFDLILSPEQKLEYNKETIKCTIPKEQMIPIFTSLIKTDLSSKPLDVLSEKIALLQILKLFLEKIDHSLIFNSKSQDFTNVINTYIRQNIQSEISLPDLASLVHLHPNYFIKYFKNHFSVTPIEYVNLLRLQMASQLLTFHPKQSIQSIASEVGFNDYRYFTRLFKKKYGVSPSQFKRLNNNK